MPLSTSEPSSSNPPRCMDGLKAVRQLDDAHLHWVAKVDRKTVD